MTKFIQIILILITCALPQFRKENFQLPQEISRELSRRKIRKRKPKNVVRKRRKEFLHPKYRSTKPRDHRFSNQKTLRRMYRNV